MADENRKIGRRKIIRLVIDALLVIAAVIIFARIFQIHTPKVIKILETGNITDVENYIRSEGKLGRYILIGLQILETVSIVLPSMPIYICAGVLFGKVQGFLMCYLTNLVMNFVIFSLARKMKATTGEFSKVERNEKLEKLMKVTDKPDLLVILMNFLPIIPNGMIPYVCEQTKMSTLAFMRGLAVGSLPAIFVYVCCGDFLLSENWKQFIPVLVVLVVIVLLVVLFRKRITGWIERVVPIRGEAR